MHKRTTAHVMVLAALALSALTWAGCAFEEDVADEDIAELQASEELALEESGAAEAAELAPTTKAPDEVESSSWGRYCVDQSYASIQYVNLGSCGNYPCQCPGSLTPHNTFSRNHPVNVHYECGAYYFVKDLWSSNYGWMRKDALRGC